jgi:hypothetical protein
MCAGESLKQTDQCHEEATMSEKRLASPPRGQTSGEPQRELYEPKPERKGEWR